METLSTESRFTALRRPIGSCSGSRTTSLGKPRMVVVHGAMSARRNRGIANVSREHDDRTSADVGWFAPPQLATPGQCGHVAAAASRNDAKSPQSSGSVIGCATYAASYIASVSAARCRASKAASASSISAASVAEASSALARDNSSASTVVLSRVLLMPQLCHIHATTATSHPAQASRGELPSPTVSVWPKSWRSTFGRSACRCPR